MGVESLWNGVTNHDWLKAYLFAGGFERMSTKYIDDRQHRNNKWKPILYTSRQSRAINMMNQVTVLVEKNAQTRKSTADVTGSRTAGCEVVPPISTAFPR